MGFSCDLAAPGTDAGNGAPGDINEPEDQERCATPTLWFRDNDGDGYGDPATGLEACHAPKGYVSTAEDCDDVSASSFPGAPQACNGSDNDCDGLVDCARFVDRRNEACSDEGSGSESEPWCTVRHAFMSAVPGDTVYIRAGRYLQREHLAGLLSTETTPDARITFRAYPGESPVITSLQLRNKVEDWTHEVGEIFSTPLTPQSLATPNVTRISHASQDGRPLRLMTEHEVEGGIGDLSGEGQWVRNTTEWKLYVWARGGGNPGNYRTAYSHFVHGGTNTMEIRGQDSRAQDDEEADYISLDGLVIEGGYYPVVVSTDHVEIRNCEIRDAYGDGIKVRGAEPDDPAAPDDPGQDDYFNADYGLIEGCDIHSFGESGIDITGGDYWTVTGNRIHDNTPNRLAGTKGNGIMLKNNNIGSVVEGNYLHDLDTAFGAFTLGGASFGGVAREGVLLRVQNNVVSGLTGPYAVGVIGCELCSLTHNLFTDISLSGSVLVLRASDVAELYVSEGTVVQNNVFHEVQAPRVYLDDGGINSGGLVSDCNLYPEGSVFSMELPVMNLADVQDKGRDTRSLEGAPSFRAGGAEEYAFRLTRGSLGVDQGCGTTLGIDYEGAARPQGPRPDMGPFER